MDEAGSDGKISKSVWDSFWESHGGDDYKGRNENVGEDGISVGDAMNLIMTRIFNAARKTGENVNALGKTWLKSIDNYQYLNADSVPATQEDEAAGTAEENDESAEQAGNNNQGAVAETRTTGQFTTESIKVKVPQKYMSAKAKAMIAANNQAKQITNYNDKHINQNNIAYVINRLTLKGLKREQLISIYKKLREQYISTFPDKTNVPPSVETFKTYPLDRMHTLIKRFKEDIIRYHNKTITQSQTEKDAFNKDRNKMQAQFDAANALLVEVANNPKKPEIERGQEYEGKWALANLADGRCIQVIYDENGSIINIAISHDTNPDTWSDGTKFDDFEVSYYSDNARVDTNKNNNKYEYTITSSYNWSELVRIAESIFGKAQ